ncbi:MAG: proprotein convertase P-domain-containing protein [Bradymonadia bacterium]
MQGFNLRYALIFGIAATTLVACEQGAESADEPLRIFQDQKPDETGAASEKMVDWKFDAWNYRNNPDGLRVTMIKTLSELPQTGEAETPAWPDTYWPTYKDSTNARWQSTDDFLMNLSPMEKYDAAFHGWDPNRVKDLRPFNGNDCTPDSFDPEYYEHLGPSAKFVSDEKGNKKTRDAIIAGELTDRCDAKEDGQCVQQCAEIEDEAAQERCEKRCDRGGVETWWGLCHAWAPAAILEREPLFPVTIPTEHGEIVFTVGDIKALYAVIYDRSRASLIGGRCNDHEVKRDEVTGRIISGECRDLNAGAFHVAMTNLLGLQKRGFVEDRTFDYEVWNQPVKGYTVNTQEEITVAEAHELLKVDPSNPTDCVTGVDLEAGDYCYNRNIDKLYKVSTSLDWLTESHASTIPEGAENLARYSRTDRYTYILEVKNGEVVGGEWYGASIDNHPDFVWLPFSPISGNRYVTVEQVRLLGEMSQTDPEAAPVEQPNLVEVASDTIDLAIPDKVAAGIEHTLLVDANGAATNAKVTVDISHTYIGDLKVRLVSPDGQVHTLHDRQGGSTDNLTKTFDLGSIAEIGGEWTIMVSDHFSADIGILKTWRLSFLRGQVDEAAVTAPLEFENAHIADIPDNDAEGINSYIDIDAEGHVKAVEVHLEVEHTYISDLEITLKRGQTSQTIHNREGGSSDNIERTYQVDAFNGVAIAGRWYLHIRDLAHRDTGKRIKWSLKVTPQ